MRKPGLVLLCTTALLPLALLLPARAEQAPLPGRQDQRMRYISYNPAQVVHLSTAVGATLVVGFGSKETVTAVAVTDSKDLAAMPRGNFLFFKSKQTLPLQPVIVLTSSESGTRRYVFDIVATDIKDLGPDAPDVYYSVQFVYPLQEAVKRRAAAAALAAKQEADDQARVAELQLQLAHERMEHQARDPLGGNRNWHYVAQGDRSIMPFEVFDNGYSTVFRFPGNVRIPSVFVINPDGKEATPNYAVKGDLLEVDAVARGWRLRDGQTVLCIWNRAFNAVGDNPGTETTSPDVQRVVKETPQ
ncbi:MAG: TrbG/VirB9 family P-type conjugative transfer protein [Janthinobacterium lividum]